jgi:hypothetical protein
VRVTAVVHGRERDGEAWLRVDRERLHLDWGSTSANNFRGRLDATADGVVSAVSVELHTEDTNDGWIDRGLNDALAEIQWPVTGPRRRRAFFDVIVAGTSVMHLTKTGAR